MDLGVGIYGSVSLKTEQWKQKKRALLDWMQGLQDNTQNKFFRDHIPGGIQSSTALPERGKGIKFIYEESNNSIYKRFEVITNKAFLDLKNLKNVGDDMNNSFGGTIYFWEICIE